MKKMLNIGLLLGLLPALIYGGLTIGYRMGLVSLSTLFGTLLTADRGLGWLIIALFAATLLEIVVGLALLVGKRGGAAGIAFLAAVVSLAMALGPLQMFRAGQDVPPIHDITTDPSDPPAFVATADERTEGMNPPAYDTEQTAQQLEAYPDIVPLEVKAAPGQAYEAALSAARGIGLDIAAADRAAGRIEGTATSRWFGFKDDVVIRIRPGAKGGSLIDMRSKSRVGKSDIGANAARLRELRELILDELGEGKGA